MVEDLMDRALIAYLTPIFWLDAHVDLPVPARAVLGLAIVPVFVGLLVVDVIRFPARS